MEYLEVTYYVEGSADEAAARTESVLLEQTIETPRSVGARYAFVREHMMGHVRTVETVATAEAAGADGTPAGVRARLALPLVTAAIDPAQFLNVLFGNSSLHPFVVLEDFDVPASLGALLRGPRFGVEGLRRRVGVYGRPLTCSALKPVGLGTDELAGLCRTFALGGIDLIKDDHYLADHPFSPFEARVRACLVAVDEAAEHTGRRALYVPNLSGTPDQVRRQADFAQAAGAEAVMVAPMLLGMPFFHELTHGRLDVPVLAHPSFGGVQRILPEAIFGKLFRLFGADAVIFANYGGRFAYPPAVCRRLADTLRRDWHGYAAAFPVPAGGMKVERTDELVAFFGQDTVLLIGGSLLEAGDHLLDRTRAFTDAVAAVGRGA